MTRFPRVEELPYRSDSTALFEGLADRPWAVFLDSGRPFIQQGRYDILAADPETVLVTYGGVTEIRNRQGTERSQEDPFALAARFLEPASVGELPFAGGAMGYFAYDLARRLETLPAIAHNAEDIPDMALGLYDWAVVNDHLRRRTYLVGQGRDPLTRKRWGKLTRFFTDPPQRDPPKPFRVIGEVLSNLDPGGYAERFQRAQRYIHQGDCYQVNLAQRFAAPATGDAWTAYRALRHLSPTPFAAYLHIPGVQVLSASPERFLQLANERVETRPIKGTRPRSSDPKRDKHLAAELAASPKDHAENVMIVDLLRNDLSKTCSEIRVPELFAVESYATVHHLVSTVTGRLRPGCTAPDVLRGCFPGGSITGAPKVRAMEIIEELEPYRRGIYCGAIGYIGYNGTMDTNIAIRTLVYSGGSLRFWAGGGIVADSERQAEYQETFDKAKAMLSLIRASSRAPQEAEGVGS